MKKVFLTSIFAFIATISFGAQFTWTAANFDSSLVGGTSYLVHSSTAVDIANIANTIETQGLTATVPSNYTNIGDASTYTVGAYALSQGDVDSTSVANPSVGQYFVVVLSADQKSYAITDAVDPNTGDGTTFSFTFANVNAWEVTSGTVGGGNVPEPTVLALLALGVAGVALRRKKMA
jgi:hypothetical protein